MRALLSKRKGSVFEFEPLFDTFKPMFVLGKARVNARILTDQLETAIFMSTRCSLISRMSW